MISPPHKHDDLKHLKKHPKGSQNAPNGTIFSKNFRGRPLYPPPTGGDTPPAFSSSTASPSRPEPRGSSCLTVSHFYFNSHIYLHSSTSCSMYQIEDRVLCHITINILYTVIATDHATC